MRILAIIPARGGSKRLPGKNIRTLGDKPLICWSIDVAKDITEICEILVSTDDNEIAAVSAAAGALVPWLRPANLATDTASTVDVVLHALDWYEEKYGDVDGILLLQPTSPFRTKDSVRNGIEAFKNNRQRTVVGVSPAENHPMWTLKIEDGGLVPFMADHGLNMRSQDLPPAYSVNGSLYLISPKELRSNNSFFNEQPTPIIINKHTEALDIDTEADWITATSALQQIKTHKNQ